MPQPQYLEKAKLIEVIGTAQTEGKVVPVQFNPQTLKLNFSNQWSGGTQPQGSSPQFVGTSTSKLSMELWFDVTLPIPDRLGDPGGDVRNLTTQVAYFLVPKRPAQGATKPEQQVPPNLKFQWGSFVFGGEAVTMDSMDETIDLFSPSGVPQRAVVSISLSKHDLNVQPQNTANGQPSSLSGTKPLSLAKAGDSLPQLAAQAGISNWQAVAQANGIANPRRLDAGSLVDLSVSV
jgi:hypothetical protein